MSAKYSLDSLHVVFEWREQDNLQTSQAFCV